MYNSEFQSIDTRNKAYVLGLFYADGYVSFQPSKRRYFSGVMLAKKDEALLDEIVEEFPFFKKTIDPKRLSTVSIRCNQKKFLEDMMNNGCHPNKSGINKDKLRFPKLAGDLSRDLIRGYFDGDGSVVLCRPPNNSRNCSITSNNYVFIRQVKYILHLNSITSRISSINWDEKEPSIIKGEKVQFKGIVYILNIHMNIKNRNRFIGYLYTDSNLKMSRKYNLLAYHKNFLKPRIPCPVCGSLKTKGQKNRIYCKDCKKTVTINGIPRIELNKKPCKHCKSLNTVRNGKTKSKKTGLVVSQIYLCRDCKRDSSYKTAPGNGDVIRVQDQPK